MALEYKPWNHNTTSKPKVVSFEAWGWPSQGANWRGGLALRNRGANAPEQQTGLAARTLTSHQRSTAPVAKIRAEMGLMSPIERFE